MKFHGFNGMLEFLEILQNRRIEYKLEQQAPDSIMVTFASVGARFELYFYEDHIEYSIFRGDESVEMSEEKLIDIMRYEFPEKMQGYK